jgi:Cu(I)/Ag(I) efflux system membrane protein CusA/SilA
VTSIGGLLPVMLGGGTGAELMGHSAAPKVGDMASAAVLTLIVVSAVYQPWREPGAADGARR